MQKYKNAKIQKCKNTNLQKYKFAKIQKCKNTNMQINKYATIQTCKYTKRGSSAKGVPVMIRIFSPIHLHKCTNTQMHKYTSIEIQKYTHLQRWRCCLNDSKGSSRLIHSHKYNFPNSPDTTSCPSYHYSVSLFQLKASAGQDLCDKRQKRYDFN